MSFAASVVAAFLIAAVLIYDRLGGNHELARRLFQVGLAASLVFLVLSATAAFVLDPEDIENGIAGNFGDRPVVAGAVHYGAGVALLLAGLYSMRQYHTIPLGLMLSGILLLIVPGGGGTLQVGAFASLDAGASQQATIATFFVALIGTGALLWYGAELEKQFAVDGTPEEEEVVEGV